MKKILSLLTILSITAFSASLQAKEKSPLLESYLSIQKSLASDKVLTRNEVLSFKSAAMASKDSTLISSIDKLSKATDIKVQRNKFKDVSSSFISYVEKNKIKGLYKASCPMASASWIQDKEEVQNPYYGSKMLTCGSSEKI